jgi:hypothetical protein
VSFGGGAADESYLTVRADWTAGPVFAAVLDASVIPYAGDLPDADDDGARTSNPSDYEREPVERYRLTDKSLSALKDLVEFLRAYTNRPPKPEVAIFRALRLAKLAEADGDTAEAKKLRKAAEKAIAIVESEYPY